jgi:branched-subunit amino acid transport protein AzlD
LAFVRFQELEQWAYVTAYYAWGNAVLLSLIVGTLWPARARASAAETLD